MSVDAYITDRRRMTAADFAHADSTFLWHDAVGNEAADLLAAITEAKGMPVLLTYLTNDGVAAIERHEIPAEHVDRVMEVLHRVAAECGAQFVRPASTRVPREPREPRRIRRSDVTVVATGGRVKVDDPRVTAIRNTVTAMSLADADEVNGLVARLAAMGRSLNLLRETTELDLALVQAIVDLAPYPSDVRIALLNEVTYNGKDDECAILAVMTRQQFERLERILIAFVAGELVLSFTSDGTVNLTEPNYKQQGGEP